MGNNLVEKTNDELNCNQNEDKTAEKVKETFTARLEAVSDDGKTSEPENRGEGTRNRYPKNTLKQGRQNNNQEQHKQYQPNSFLILAACGGVCVTRLLVGLITHATFGTS